MIFKILLVICKLFDKAFGFENRFIPVLLYHSVSNSSSRLSVTPENFKRQMEYIEKKGYKSILPKDLDDPNNTKKRFVITFDDGFKDNYSAALPILEKHGFTAVVFIAAKYIGGKSVYAGKEADREFFMMNIEEIKEIERKGWVVANHFYSHSNLHDLNKADLLGEYKRSKKVLERIITKKENTSLVAYPRNKINKNVIDILKMEGVRTGFSGMSGMYKIGNDKLIIPRIEIDRDATFIKFKLYLSPTFQILKKSKSAIL